MTALLTPGQPSLPSGLAQCPADPAKSDLRTPAACDDSTLPSPASPVAASNASGHRTRVMPSVPQSTLHPATTPAATLALTADRTSLRSGESVILTATATSSVTGTASAIEIFDQTTATLAGACMQSSRCLVGYSATSGAHSFTAFTTAPTMAAPAPGSAITSNSIQVSWIDVTLSAGQPAVVGPGKAVALTASTSVDVGRLGLVLLLWDLTSAAPLTYCSQGTSCSTMLTYQTAGSHHIVAFVALSASATPGSDVRATSNAAVLTWLSVALVANTTYPQAGGTVNLTAVANVDLTGTPWSLGILDQGGMLVDKPCKTGSACNARVTLIGGATPYFSAVIGTAPAAVDAPTMADQWLRRVTDRAPLGDIQVRSAWVQPTRILWGVDSCKPMTGDANGAGGLYPQVASILGSPDFWGRYLTTTGNCPGISSAEVAAAARNKVGILPIYNDYDCSAVSSSDTGQAYADAATSAAENLGIPKRTVIMIDIEPPGYWCSGAVDSGFVKGWYFGVSAAGYSPGFYGDGTSWSTFGQAFCGAVADQPVIGARSYLWSFEPSLITSYPKASAPQWGPYQVGCAGNMVAWQYELSAGDNPDVDRDEALSKLPLWFP